MGQRGDHGGRARPGRPAGGSSEETYDRILAAARRQFAERGYATTSNRSVAREAGVTAPSLYHYFRSKPVLYVAVYRDAERRMSERFRVAMEGVDRVPERIRAIAVAATELYEEDPSILEFVAAVSIEMQQNPELARGVGETEIEIFDLLASVIDDGKANGELPADLDRDGAAYGISAMTVGVALLARTIGGAYYGRMLGALVAMIDD